MKRERVYSDNALIGKIENYYKLPHSGHFKVHFPYNVNLFFGERCFKLSSLFLLWSGKNRIRAIAVVNNIAKHRRDSGWSVGPGFVRQICSLWPSLTPWSRPFKTNQLSKPPAMCCVCFQYLFHHLRQAV